MKNSICRDNAGMRDLLVAINQEPAGIAFVVDEQNKLCGVVTDGDFRRMLLAGKSLEDRITRADLRPYVFAKQGQSLPELLAKTDKRVRVIPIVNDKNEPVDYFRYEHRVHLTPVAEPDLKGNELKYLTDAFLSTWISSKGKYINEFEKNFSSFCETAHGVSVCNGSVAIHLALKALNIGNGDEVIIPDLTFAATANAVINAGATPVIVDVDEESWCISPAEIEKAISPKTKAIIPVHLYGQPCDMDAIMALAKKHSLRVIEDCAEAHGAKYRGKKIGSFGDVGCFSFYGNKIITTGEGGMCVTDSSELNNRMRILRDHGMNLKKKYWHDEVGFNYRLTNLQAAIGVAQLERIGEIISVRKETETQYKKMLKNVDFLHWQNNLPGRERVVWLVSLLVNGISRDELAERLTANGIEVRPFFYPLSDMEIYKPYSKPCPVSKKISENGFNLPTISNPDFEKIKTLIESFRDEYSGAR